MVKLKLNKTTISNLQMRSTMAGGTVACPDIAQTLPYQGTNAGGVCTQTCCCYQGQESNWPGGAACYEEDYESVFGYSCAETEAC